MISAAFLLDKPEGLSSFGALDFLKSEIGTRKVGHTGTLDPFASGLIVALSGKMTRLSSYVTTTSKSYTATMKVGAETDTLDPTGEIIRQSLLSDPPSQSKVEKVLSSFVGTQMQRPPHFSAIHVNGRRAYDLARSDKPFNLDPRQIEVLSISLKEYEFPYITFETTVSKGTYVRALARDIGERLGSCAYLVALRRTSVGPFLIDDVPAGEPYKKLSPFELLVKASGIDVVYVKKEFEPLVTFGKPLENRFFYTQTTHPGVYALFSFSRQFLALGSQDRIQRWKYIFKY